MSMRLIDLYHVNGEAVGTRVEIRLPLDLAPVDPSERDA